ncbi:MAG: hypothetical protein ACPGXY_02045 [Alphaproteobacteria bacterium]
MQDYGLYKTIKRVVQQDETLRSRITAVVTHASDETVCPYVVYELQDHQSDCALAPQDVRVDFSLKIHSRYAGSMEVCGIMNQLRQIMESKPHQIAGRRGDVVFKVSKLQVAPLEDKITRIGHIQVQARIKPQQER